MTADMYRRWLDELWNGDLDQLETLAAKVVTEDFVGSWPRRPGHVHGPRELAAVIRQGRTTFDELRFSVHVGPIADGDLLAARWKAEGSYDARPVEFHGHDVLRLSGDRFGEYWVIGEDISDQLS